MAGLTVAIASSTTLAISVGSILSRAFPSTMRETSSTSSTICASDAALRSITSSACGTFLGRDGARLQHSRVAKHRVQRRSQLVRQRRQKFILQPVGVLERR